MEITNFHDVNYWIKAAERDYEIVEELFKKKETNWIYLKLSDFLTKILAVRSLMNGKNPEEEIDNFSDYILECKIDLSDREKEVLKELDLMKAEESLGKKAKLLETLYDEAELISQIAVKLVVKK